MDAQAKVDDLKGSPSYSTSGQKPMQQSEKAINIAKEQISIATIIAKDAVHSGAYAWPIRGQYYFLTHPSLVKPVLPDLIKSTLFTVVVTILLFFLTYFPTVAILAFVSGPFAFIAAIPIILGEGAAIGIVVSRIFWLGQAMEQLFDEVLIRDGLTKLVSKGREMKSDSQHGRRIGKLLTKPLQRFSKESIIRWLISLPLNAIPFIGPAAFFLYNGAKSGPSYHARYFQLKSNGGPIESQPPESVTPAVAFSQEEFVGLHRAEYSAFGAMAMALNVLVPGGAILCMFGNQVGAALWASEMEKSGAGKKTE